MEVSLETGVISPDIELAFLKVLRRQNYTYRYLTYNYVGTFLIIKLEILIENFSIHIGWISKRI